MNFAVTMSLRFNYVLTILKDSIDDDLPDVRYSKVGMEPSLVYLSFVLGTTKLACRYAEY